MEIDEAPKATSPERTPETEKVYEKNDSEPFVEEVSGKLRNH